MNTPVAAFFKTVGNAAFGYMLPILAGFIAMSIADRPGLAVGFAGGVLAMNGTNFAGLASGDTTGISGELPGGAGGLCAGYIVQFLKKITEKLPASLNGIRPMLIYPLGGILVTGLVMCGINPVMGIINTAMTDWLNAMGGTSKVLLGAIVAGMMSIDMGGPSTRRPTSLHGGAGCRQLRGHGGCYGRRHGAPDCDCPVYDLCPKVEPRRAPQRHRELRYGPLLCHRGRDPVCCR